jgi:hypothetical protein
MATVSAMVDMKVSAQRPSDWRLRYFSKTRDMRLMGVQSAYRLALAPRMFWGFVVRSVRQTISLRVQG